MEYTYTLADGTVVRLTPAMEKAIREADPFTRAPNRLAVRRYDASQTIGALMRRDLVEFNSLEDEHFLTLRGVELRARLLHAVTEATTEQTRGSHAPNGREPERLTVHPELSDEDEKRLYSALPKQVRGKGDGSSHGRSSNRGPGVGISLAGIVLVLLIILAIAPAVFAAFLIFGMFVALMVRENDFVGRIGQFCERHPWRRDPQKTALAPFQGRFVSADMLDKESCGLLGRIQSAVDTVLESSPHRQGLLLDTVRNRVVLADVEWSLAESLLRQSNDRKRIVDMPTPGERSRQAAERARAALDEDVRRVLSRVRTLEDYAAKVRAAEIDEQDRRAAAELEAIADSTAQAAAPQQDEALESLVQAQELALRVAALADPDE